MVAWLALLGALALPVFAAAPEAPVEVSVSPVKATEATFHGFLNPAASEPVAAGTYEFLYKKSATECTVGSKAPAGSPAISRGNPHEEVSETVTGLEANTTYTVCLLARNGTKVGENEVLSTPPVTFTTATPAEKPETKPATGETATTATLNGVLNPKAKALVEAGWYFVYSTGEKCTSGGTGSGETAHEVPAKVKALAVKTEATGLEPNKAYKFCLVATNTAEESTVGNEVSLKTLSLPPALEGLTASGVTPSAATLEAQVNPENEPTECRFEYGPVKAVKLEKEASCEQGSTPGMLEGYGNQTASANVKLAAGTTYYYRLIVKSEAGKAEGEEQLITPTPATPAVASEAVSNVTPTEATLEAQVNPNFQKTTYTFEYATNPALTSATVLPGAALEGFGEQTASCPTGAALQVGVTYYYRVVVENTANHETIDGTIQSFTPEGSPLTAFPVTVSDVLGHTATLSGSVNPAGLSTTYRIAYADQVDYEQAVAEHNANPYAFGSSTLSGSVSAAYQPMPIGPIGLSELTPGTVYHYAIVATNSAGETVGPDHTFTTTAANPPLATTGATSGLSEVSATIEGTVDTRGMPTTVQFELLEPGATKPREVLASAESSTGTVQQFAALLNGSLQAGATYRYRIAAENRDGTTYGEWQSFTTPALPVLAQVAPAAYAPLASAVAPPVAEHKTVTKSTKPKPQTKLQKLAKALEACHKKPKKRRAGCNRAAEQKYGPIERKQK